MTVLPSHHIRLAVRASMAGAVLVAVAPLAGCTTVQACGTFQTVDVEGRQYVAQNNVWGASTAQCIDVTGPVFKVSRSEHANPTNGAPASYPSIFEGCHWEDCTVGSELPIQVDDLDTARTTWQVTATPDGAWNAAYDVWFKTDPAPGPPDGAELMIWLDSRGGVQPAGSIVARDVPLAGATWHVWQAQIGWNLISYQRTSPTAAVDFDLQEFVADAVARGAVQPTWHMVTVEAGFELWRGGVGLTSHGFSFTGAS
jgi:hypothetical protein